jgi:antitoxin (DNA-binding transcriptional repressor) of toxin-antitoxin stability system
MRKQLKKYGMRQAKAHLSEIARDAAAGVCTIITDNRNPVAMVGPLPADEAETEIARQLIEVTKSLSDAAAFRKALLGAPFPLELDF